MLSNILHPTIRTEQTQDIVDIGIKYIRKSAIRRSPGGADHSLLFVLSSEPLLAEADLADGYGKCHLSDDGDSIILDSLTCQCDENEVRVVSLPQLRNTDKFTPVALRDGVVPL